MANTIKVYTSENEYTNTRYYVNAELLDTLPAEGALYRHGIVNAVIPVQKDWEQAGDAAERCDLYKLVTDEAEYYVAVLPVGGSIPVSLSYSDLVRDYAAAWVTGLTDEEIRESSQADILDWIFTTGSGPQNPAYDFDEHDVNEFSAAVLRAVRDNYVAGDAQ